jgi:PDZ domain-containing protein/carboxypeptidase family protein
VFQRPVVTLSSPPADAAAAPVAANGAFEGRVISAISGSGLPHAELAFAHEGATTSVVTATDGTFRFQPHATGHWFLAGATAEGHLPFAPEWGQSPVLLDARPGQVVRGITITLSPADALEGRVVDSSDEPVSGADVRVLGGGAGATTLVPLKDRFRSGPDGSFRFTAPEDAIVEASREGYALGRARVDYTVRVSHKLTVTLKPIEDARLAIGGSVTDQVGSPAEGALVSARSKANPAEAPATARADVEGKFKLTGLEAGTWVLVATRAGSAPSVVEVPAGTDGVGIRLTSGGRLAGRVTDERSRSPVAPFTVLVQSLEMKSLSIIDPGGRYELDDLTPGPAVVSVVAPSYAPSPEIRVTIPEPGAAPATADFELRRGGSLTGLVVERGTAQPIAGAVVAVDGTSASLGIPVRNETLTGGDGRFTLGGVPENTIGIMASAPGHHARIISAPTIPDGETRGPVTIELTPVKDGEEPRVELAGIGAMLEKAGDVLRITMVARNGGAAEVGLAPGDEIVSINGATVKPMTLTDAVPLLRGPEGTTVTLGVMKASDSQRATVTVVVPRRLVRG